MHQGIEKPAITAMDPITRRRPHNRTLAVYPAIGAPVVALRTAAAEDHPTPYERLI